MATNEELAQGLRVVQRVVWSNGLIELASGGAALEDCHDDPKGTPRAWGVPLPEEIRRVEWR